MEKQRFVGSCCILYTVTFLSVDTALRLFHPSEMFCVLTDVQTIFLFPASAPRTWEYVFMFGSSGATACSCLIPQLCADVSPQSAT